MSPIAQSSSSLTQSAFFEEGELHNHHHSPDKKEEEDILLSHQDTERINPIPNDFFNMWDIARVSSCRNNLQEVGRSFFVKKIFSDAPPTLSFPWKRDLTRKNRKN